MNSIAHEQLEKCFRAALRQEALTLKELTVAQALASFVQHWRMTTITDLGDAPDDGLVVNFDLLQDRGTNFVMTVCRVASAVAAPDSLSSWRPAWRPAWRLALQIGAKPDLGIFQLRPGVATFDCWNKSNAPDFEMQVATSPQFQALSLLPVNVARVHSSACQSPTWQMNHPVHGLGWAL